MPEQLICPRCGTPNAPTATSCYYCGWAPTVGPSDSNNPAAGGHGGNPAAGGYGGAPSDPGPHGFGEDANGPTFAGAYAAGEVGAASGGYDAAGAGAPDQGSYGQGSYGPGSYGQGSYGQGSYGGGGYGVGAGYPAGPGNTQYRGSGGAQPPAGGSPAAGSADKPDRNKLLMIGAGVVGGLVVIALVVFVIFRFLTPGDGQTTGPGPSPSTQGRPTVGPGPTSPTVKTPAPPAAPNYDKIANQVKSGVLKVYATACGSDATRIGSAFLIANDTAVASYASLAGAQVIAVSTGSGLVSAAVSSADVDHGIVILKLNRSVGGHIFAIDTSTAKIGDPVGLLGYAATASSPQVKTTKITGTSQTARVGSSSIGGLEGTALASDDGWAGAPTLSSDGAANGMVMAGPGAAQAMIVPGAMIKAAESSGGQLPGGTCNDPRGPAVTTIGGTPTQAVKKTLHSYFNGINTGDYHTAYKQLGPHSNSGPFSGYVNGWRSAYDFNIVVESVTGSGDGTHAQVSFDSITLPGQGPKGHTEATCAHWDMGYTFADDGGHLLINDVTANASLC